MWISDHTQDQFNVKSAIAMMGKELKVFVYALTRQIFQPCEF